MRPSAVSAKRARKRHETDAGPGIALYARKITSLDAVALEQQEVKT